MLTERQRKELAAAMYGDTQFTQANDAGYTYLGQFVAHDIVMQTNPPPNGGRDVSPFLDLDSVYGKETLSRLDSNGFFRIGTLLPGGADLWRVNGVAQIPEQRNDDNVIVSQLHLLWQRLHNFTLRKNHAAGPEEARRLVTLVFQLLIVEDYLRLVLAPAVFDSYFRNGERWLNFNPSKIPSEFSHAVFRFGHSMVRPFYDFSRRSPREADLRQLFQPGRDLDPSLVVQWGDLFGWPGLENGVQDASMIDPFATGEMAIIVLPTGGTVNIVEKNLAAGDLVNLPSGVDYVDQLLSGPKGRDIHAKFKLERLSALWPQLARNLGSGTSINIGNLPLWPYILCEAAESPGEGRHLGTLGSLVCADVLSNSIAYAKHSICPRDASGIPRWPHSMDRVLDDLGRLGEKIREAQANAPPDAAESVPPRLFCMRHIIELLGNEFQLEQSIMEIPQILESWVAKPGQAPTLIVNPCYIDYRAVGDLHFYQPGFGGTIPYSFRHVAAEDAQGRPFVRVDSISHNWDQKMATVARALKLYPEKLAGYDVLVDTAIANVETPLMHGWKVSKWTVAKGRDTMMDLVHQDFIEWTKDNVQVQSMFSWRPYLPEKKDEAGATMNERVVHLHVNLR